MTLHVMLPNKIFRALIAVKYSLRVVLSSYVTRKRFQLHVLVAMRTSFHFGVRCGLRFNAFDRLFRLLSSRFGGD